MLPFEYLGKMKDDVFYRRLMTGHYPALEVAFLLRFRSEPCTGQVRAPEIHPLLIDNDRFEMRTRTVKHCEVRMIEKPFLTSFLPK